MQWLTLSLCKLVEFPEGHVSNLARCLEAHSSSIFVDPFFFNQHLSFVY